MRTNQIRLLSFVLQLALMLVWIMAAAAEEQRPNILLVVADDMGWTDLGCFGSEIETPNIDALAQRGVKFTDFYVSVSCSPTRSMLLSGNDNHIAGWATWENCLRKTRSESQGTKAT